MTIANDIHIKASTLVSHIFPLSYSTHKKNELYFEFEGLSFYDGNLNEKCGLKEREVVTRHL